MNTRNKLDYPEEFLQCVGLTCNWEVLGAEPDTIQGNRRQKPKFGIRIYAVCTTCGSIKHMVVSKADSGLILVPWKYERPKGYRAKGKGYVKADFRAELVRVTLRNTRRSELHSELEQARRKRG